MYDSVRQLNENLLIWEQVLVLAIVGDHERDKSLLIRKVLVLIYSFIVLILRRRDTKKRAAAEETEKGEQDGELRPMLTLSNEIPFGARALEKGVQVDGIWVSNSNTPISTPEASSSGGTRPSSPTPDPPARKVTPGSTNDALKPRVPSPLTTHSEPSDPQPSPQPSQTMDDSPSHNDKPEESPRDLLHVNQYTRLLPAKPNDFRAMSEPDLHPAKRKRDSWPSQCSDLSLRRSATDGTSSLLQHIWLAERITTEYCLFRTSIAALVRRF